MRILRSVALVAVLFAVSCGDSPNNPGPINNPPPPPPPPVNNTAPVISSITVQGTKRNEPPNISDLGEAVAVTAVVTDAETNVDSLQYSWTATLGSFAGTGARVSWVAPPTAAITPVTVTITLEIVERFGTNQENRVSKTATVALHDSVTEVTNMSVRFLTEFSKPQSNQDLNDIMRDFKASVCPVPGEVTEEQAQVRNHYQNFFVHTYSIQPVRVTVDFGGTCVDGYGPLRGDACAAVAVMWDSTDLRNKIRATTRGTDYLTAMFVPADDRWWLCSSRLPPTATIGNPFYLR